MSPRKDELPTECHPPAGRKAAAGSAFAGNRDAAGRRVLGAMPRGRVGIPAELVRRVLVRALEVVADRFLGVRRQRVHDLADPGSPAARSGMPGVAMICGGTPSISSTPPSW